MKHIGLYIHIPFCKHKCYYCDFISFEKKENEIERYVQALKKEIILVKKENKILEDTIINTIYIGGGTPSYINEKYIEEILNLLKSKFNFSKEIEITIEVNPGTVSKEKFELYKKCGINRISMGLQSCDEKVLKTIARIHNYETFLNCYEMARNAGFKNINVDLMLGIPNQTIESLKDSLEKVIKLSPEHISIYSLILEENTKMYDMVLNGRLKMLDENLERDMYWNSKDILEKAGYKQYEISNFAKDGLESKHNLNCWNQCEYVGFGVAAHSYFNQVRFSNVDDLESYIKNMNEVYNQKYEKDTKNSEIDSKRNVLINEKQDEEMQMKEFMLLGLRKIDGIKISDFKQKFSENPIYYFRKELEKLTNQKLIEIDENEIHLTKMGIDFANIAWSEFI